MGLLIRDGPKWKLGLLLMFLLFIVQRKALLEVIKETVLSHLTKKCPPHVRALYSSDVTFLSKG